MPDTISPVCVERGGGYWCYYTRPPVEMPPIVAPPDADFDKPTFNEQLVYRPVEVGVNDDGEAYAYYYDEDADFEELVKNGGKKFVPTQQVYATPLPDAEPAYKYKPKTPPR